MASLISDHPFRSPLAEQETGLCLVDESLSNHTAGTCDLFALFCGGGLSISLQERRSRKFLALETLPNAEQPGRSSAEQFRLAVNESRILKEFEFSRSFLGFGNAWYTLVPNGLFQQGDETRLLRFTQSRSDLQAFHQRIQGFDARLIFGLEPELYHMAAHLFQNPVVLHAVGAQLERASLESSIGNQPTVSLHLSQRELDILVYSGKKLLLQNSFPVNTADEVLYYTLFVLERLELMPDQVNLEIFGSADPRSGALLRLKDHLPQLRVAGWPDYFQASYKLLEVPAYRHLDLFSLSLCSS